MGVLGHVLEAAGLATVALASQRPVMEKLAPPRALYCEFPLGRPLGRPNDAAFQRDVLAKAFALLEAEEGPVLGDYPEAIHSDEAPVSCVIPAAFDSSLHPAVAEASGIRKAYDRTLAKRGVTSVGRSIGPDEIGGALEVLVSIADGADWKTAGIPGKNTTALIHDIRTYYEEAALELVDTPDPQGRALESWFYETTEAGKLVMAARTAMKDQDAPFPAWFYMAPGQR